VRTADSTARAGAALEVRSAKMTKKGASRVQPPDAPRVGTGIGAKTPTHKDSSSPRQLRSTSEKHRLERIQRMTELWGSPDGSAGAFSHSSSQYAYTQSCNSPRSPAKNSLQNEKRLHARSTRESVVNRMQSSPKTPTTPSAIPRLIRPSSAVAALEAAHASMNLAISKDISQPSPLNDKASISDRRSPLQIAARIIGANREKKASLASKLPQSPSMGITQLPQTSDSQNANQLYSASRSEKTERAKESSPRSRSGEQVLSTEEQELKVCRIIFPAMFKFPLFHLIFFQLCTFTPHISPKPHARPASAPSLKAPGFDGAVLRLQRAKIERERLKQAAERAFDYTAPPPPKNMQAISQLALPVSSRAISGKSTANTAPAANIAPAGNLSNDGIKTRDERSHESNQSQLFRASFGVQHSSHNHMSPAVAAALSKVQSKQISQKNPAKMSPELLTSVWRDLDSEKAGRVTPDNAVGRDGSSLAPYLQADGNVGRDTPIGSPLTEIKEGNQSMAKGQLLLDSKSDQMAANSLQQLAMLLIFDDDRYGVEGLDAVQGNTNVLSAAESGRGASDKSFVSIESTASGSFPGVSSRLLHSTLLSLDDSPKLHVLQVHNIVVLKAATFFSHVLCAR
jgi:hypothetical protein